MAKKVYKTSRKFHCPYCGALYPRTELIDHVNKEHESLIPEGYTATRVVYEAINKTDHGTCMICKKNVYEWNEKTSRYNNLCDNPKCREEVRRIALERHIKVYNKPSLLDDPEHQEKMLGNRRISGKYCHSDGTEFTYTGRYEKATIEFMDKVMGIPSKDIQMPGPVLEYEFEGETHHWITDIYYIPANLIIEVKDGGDNPNKRNMPVYRGKQAAKEVMITNLGKFNYLRLTNNNFSQLLEALADIKYENLDQKEASQVKYYINESTRLELLREDKSELDENFKSKEVIKLSSFKRVHITESVIEKYEKEYPVLKHVRCKDTKDYVCDGYMWFDGDKLACYVGSCEYLDDHTKWIVSLEITPEYKGHDLSKQIVDFAVKSMGCKYLSVNKNNKIAKHVYDKYGFKSYQDDDHMNYMTIDSGKAFLKESTVITEKVFRSTEDIYWNKDKFDSGEINLCFITGLSGSGKSTMGRDMQKDGIEHYELDDVCTNWNFSDDNLKEYGDLIYSFFKGPGKKYRYHSTDEFLEDKEWDGKDGKDDGYEPCVIRDFVKYAISYAKSHKSTKFVLEGVWMFLFFEPSYFKDYAFYIKGTSMILSNIRGAKRDVGNQIDKEKHPLVYKAKLIVNINQHWLYYIKDELKIRKFVDYYSKLVMTMNESSTSSTKLYRISESSNWDGAVISPRVPRNYMTDNGYEDDKTPRVCFSTSINGCLRAMSANLKNKEFYVFIPDGKYDFYRPTVKEVPDQLVTNEVWIKEDVKLKMIGKIHVSEAKDRPMRYNYGTDKYAELYDWKWRWEEKIKEEVGGIPASSGRYSTFIIPYMMHNTFDIAIGCDKDDEVLMMDNGELELRDLASFEDEFNPNQILVYSESDAVEKFERIKRSKSIGEAITILTGHKIHHIDEFMLCENLKLRDFATEDASLDMIYNGIIRENEILSGAIKVHDNPTAIKGHVILAKTMDGGCFIHTPNDYYLSSDIYSTPEDIPQNVIDTMEDLYVSNRKETV